MPIVMDTTGYKRGSEPTFHKPKETRWQAQDQYADHLRDASTGDKTCMSAWTWMNLR